MSPNVPKWRKIVPFSSFLGLHSCSLEPFPGTLYTMASVKWYHQHYLPFSSCPDPGAIRLTNLEQDKTNWGQWYKKEQSSKASLTHLDNDRVRLSLLTDSISSNKISFYIWWSRIISSSKTWIWEPSGDSDCAITSSLSLHEAQFSHLGNGCDNGDSPFHFIRVSLKSNT